MKTEREIIINGNTFEFQTTSDNGILQIEIDGVRHDVRFVELPDSRIMALVDGKVIEIDSLSAPNDRQIYIDGKQLMLDVVDPRSRRAGFAGMTGGSGRAEIKAPMPGKVVRVLTEVGDTVEADQGVVVLEAMKMENELRSPISGKVVKIDAEQGSAVEMGHIIAIIEPVDISED